MLRIVLSVMVHLTIIVLHVLRDNLSTIINAIHNVLLEHSKIIMHVQLNVLMDYILILKHRHVNPVTLLYVKHVQMPIIIALVVIVINCWDQMENVMNRINVQLVLIQT